MLLYDNGSPKADFSDEELKKALVAGLEKLGRREKVLAVPPDFTRFHSKAGVLTCGAYEYYGPALKDILPALGTHFPMTDEEIDVMYPGLPHDLFRVHDWRKDVVTLGEVPASFVKEVSEGAVDYPWPAQVNRLLSEGGHDLILSIGQVVPHEVVGMASFNKNIFVGTGGAEGINKSHFLGAAYGMERMMGRADTPVRKVLNYASREFASHLPIVHALTVVGRGEDGQLKTRGLFVGDDEECFRKASELSLQVNFEMLEEPLEKVVVWLDPQEYKSTWLGNKSVYRTRMALADGGELIVVAPGLREFGEDPEIDRLIRKYGYRGTPDTLKAVKENEDLRQNLSAAAHLIHGSSEGRFSVTYCPGQLSQAEIEGVNFRYADLKDMSERYQQEGLKDGFNRIDGVGEVFYISNPAVGLWAAKERFEG